MTGNINPTFGEAVDTGFSYDAIRFGVRSFHAIAEELEQHLQRCRLYSQNTSTLISRIKLDLQKLPENSPIRDLIRAPAYRTTIDWDGKFDPAMAGAGAYSISIYDNIFDNGCAIRPKDVDVQKLILASEKCRTTISNMIEFARIQNFRLHVSAKQEEVMQEYNLSPNQEHEIQENFYPIRFHFGFLPLMPFDKDELQPVIDAIAKGNDPEYDHDFSVAEPQKPEYQAAANDHVW